MNEIVNERKGLKSAISICTKSWPLPRDFHPYKTINVVDNICKEYDLLNTKAPEVIDLQTTKDALLKAVVNNQSFKSLPKRFLRLTPWVIFYPSNQPDQWLANHQLFTSRYINWIIESGHTRSIASLFQEFLNYYPQNLSTFNVWRKGLEFSIARQTNKRIESLKSYCQYAGYLDNNGTEIFAEKLFLDPQPDFHASESGLNAKLLQSVFLKEALIKYSVLISKALRNFNIPSEKLLDHLKLFESQDGQIRFSDIRNVVAECLLHPFINSSPPEDITIIIRSFLLKHLKDPRFVGSRWGSVDPDSRQVMLRWLVTLALEDFFKLLDDTATEGIWRYRRAFWSAYLKNGAITDAWVILGKNAKHLASSYRGDQPLRYGKLSGGTSDQSALLIKIRNLTIVEWSHSGACRFFTEINPNKPEPYKWDYNILSLKSMRADEEIRHSNSEGGRWQANIANMIYEYTNIHVSSRDYMPTGYY